MFHGKCVIYHGKDADGKGMRDCVGGGIGVGVGTDTLVDLRFGARDLGWACVIGERVD